LGEEVAVDLACAGLDRAARRLLDEDRWRMWTRIEAAVTAGLAGADRRVHWAAATLRPELGCLSPRRSVDGARHTLDALLVAVDGGHAPGTRVRILGRTHPGRTGTIVGAQWTDAGRPIGYEVRLDASRAVLVVAPGGLTIVEDQTDSVPTPA
jgi:hypothetical protein